MSDHHAPSAPDHQNRVLAQLKFLVVLLVISNVALGLFGVYVLRQVDRKYSDLIDQAVPSLNELQTLTAASMQAMRSTNPVFFADLQGRAAMAKQARHAIEGDRDLRRQALQRKWFSLKADERPDFEKAGDAFSKNAEEVVKLFESADAAAAGRLREQSLRPAFDRYVAATTEVADALEAQSLKTSDEFTARTGSMSHILLGLASWPVVLISLFFLFALLFVIGVLLRITVFRGAEV